MNMDDSVIEIKDLHKKFTIGEQEEHIIHGLDLSVKRNEVITILGVSGTGKSTLLNMIGGIDKPTAGTIVAGDTEITSMTDEQLTGYRRNYVGFVFQFYNLIPTLTAEENVLSALEAKGKVRKEDRETSREVLASIGLARKTGKFPEQLSGGEQQRVAIARAIIKKPPLILADEPTGNLDPQTGQRVVDVLIDHIRETGATLLIVSHNTAFSEVADRTLALREGRLQPYKED
jgi:putative ABC transport system ATP-binding protein